MSKNGNILTCEDLFKSYHMGLTNLQVLKGLSLEVKKGEFVAIIGASGSGKSTLLHILGALDRPDKGRVCFEGNDLARLSGRKLNKLRNKKIGFVFQFYHLLDELNVVENVTLPAMVASGTLNWLRCAKSVKKRALELIEMLGIAERAKHKPYQLSGGERQRVALGRALINQPQVLLADEPTGNLDSETGNGILNALGRLRNDGQTIVMVTHDEKIAERADKVIKLVDGKI